MTEIEELNLEPIREWLKTKVESQEIIELLLSPVNIEETLDLYDKR